MGMESLLFYILAAIIVFFSVAVVLVANPIYSALYLAITMVSLAFVFFLLQAPFIAGVQLIVYAGAVMVLFVMVLMLFDLKAEQDAFSKGKFTTILKVASCGWLAGLIGGAIFMSSEMLISSPVYSSDVPAHTTKDLATLLFSKYLFAFEALGLLLLLVAVGVVAISRVKGGTHAQH